MRTVHYDALQGVKEPHRQENKWTNESFSSDGLITIKVETRFENLTISRCFLAFDNEMNFHRFNFTVIQVFLYLMIFSEKAI